MWLILYLVIIGMVYVGTFREDFSDEHISVLTKVLFIAVIVIIITTLL